MADQPAYIMNDKAVESLKDDALDFTPYVQSLADIIMTGSTPLTIGVFGTWGSGKTSLMKMVQEQVPKQGAVAGWFDAWKYDKEDALWRAFLLSVLSAVRASTKEDEPTEDLDYLETMLYRAIDLEKAGGVTIDLAKLVPKLTQGAVQIGLSFIPGGTALADIIKKLQEMGTENLTENAFDAIQRERSKIHIEQVRFLEQFQDKFRELVKQRLTNNGKRLVVFVDDLDRCLPEKAIEVLEAIKLFVDAPGCVFVLGLDQEVIARGIEMKYKELGNRKDAENQSYFTIEGMRYLEKIIQLPFTIPQVERADMSGYVHNLTEAWPDEECPRIFVEGLGNNPRQIKRTVNVFLMLWNLAAKRKAKLEGRIKPIRLAKVVAIQAVYPDLYNLLLKDEPRYLREAEEYFRAESLEEKKGQKEEMTAEKAAARVEPPPALAPFLSRRGAAAVRRILTLHMPGTPDANFAGLTPDELRLYFTLTRPIEAPLGTPVAGGSPVVTFEPQMIRIPAGKFLMGSTAEQAAQAVRDGLDKKMADFEQPQHLVELSEYFIGKYPITNREYQAFVKEAQLNLPRGWDGDQYPPEKGDHPVVNVSWQDASAYCQWLSEKTKRTYRLPTEAEWEKAARGEDGRVWPWGSEFGMDNANTQEARLNDTSPVGQFSPRGDSLYGCADTIGNAWEWCADWFSEGEYKTRQAGVKDPQGPPAGNARVLRGGSFNDYRANARCAYRLRFAPFDFINIISFRVVRSPIFESAL